MGFSEGRAGRTCEPGRLAPNVPSDHTGCGRRGAGCKGGRAGYSVPPAGRVRRGLENCLAVAKNGNASLSSGLHQFYSRRIIFLYENHSDFVR
jgi:hypothetical protein